MHLLVVHGHRDAGTVGISPECLSRVRRAERVHADLVLLSGAGLPESKSEAEQMQSMWNGWPGATVFRDDHAHDTVENVFQSIAFAATYDCDRVTLVTSWWHVPRLALLWRGRKLPRKFVAARGSLRYVPGELVALIRTIGRR